ncbi:sigma-54-dependent Fis family transcriptional regulator [candidate division KSB1 bacterium]|nr:sigma-54-dependent Fis family transcriptional regulator [candidate division KSB1 bacterium]
MDESTKILIVDDDEIYRHTYALILAENGYNVTAAANGEKGLEQLYRGFYSIVFVDYRMPDMDGVEFLRRSKAFDPSIDVVLITAFATIETAVEAIKLGAYDYLNKPTKAEKLLALVKRLEERQQLLRRTAGHALNLDFDGTNLSIIGVSAKMQEIFEIISKIAPTDSTVLILGESGTGKELIAKAIHANSLRRKNPFLTMDCGTLVESLFESELFGHVKGSFTGAIATKHGAFELAHAGTFFFDEIGNISLNVQAKILRAIQEKEIRPVGGIKTVEVDVRVIAATNLDLLKAVDEGRFREDLYYRLSVIPLYLPPLRDRTEDIPDLVNHFIKRFAMKKRDNIVVGVSDKTMEYLLHYSWPGNVRELSNVIERAVVLEEDTIIHPESLPMHVRGVMKQGAGDDLLPLSEMEKQHIRYVLHKTNFNISKAARILKIDRKTLYDKIKKYDL